MNKKLWLAPLLAVSLFATESSAEDIAQDTAELEVAKSTVEEAKLEMETAKKKLDAAQKIIDKEAEKHLSFSSHTELGYVSTSGNTDTKTGSLDAMGKWKLEKNTLQLDIDYIYGEQSGIENKNKFAAELNYDYRFSKHFAFNYLVGYKDDKFSGYDYQFYTGPGIKYVAIENDVHILNFQTNILYSSDAEMDKFYTDATYTIETPYPYVPVQGAFVDPASGQTNEYASFLIKGDYAWNITGSLKFIQDLSYRTDIEDSDIYFVNSKTGLLSKINSTFSMGVNYKIDYVNTPPVGNEHTDKTFTLTLSIDY